jgi:predicted phosphohydrolase
MKIQYCSDLHLEFWENKEFLKQYPLQPKGDILVLAGDIVPFAVMQKHNDFFDYVSENFTETYWVPGNHEYYHSDIAEYRDLKMKEIRPNVFLVNNSVIEKDNFRLIFSSLWSHISEHNQWVIRQSVSDFHVIKFNEERLLPFQFNELHEESLSFLKRELLRDYNGKTIVTTHHVPTFLNYPEKYKGSELNEAFGVELFDFIENSKTDYWIFGHHHQNIPGFEIGSTKLVTNQLGYVKYNENQGFENDKIIL